MLPASYQGVSDEKAVPVLSRRGRQPREGTYMVRRGEITDRAWQEIEPLLPQYGQSAGQWRDHRTVVNGILWKLRTGSPWRDVPERYGP
jgi:hypothetical protein